MARGQAKTALAALARHRHRYPRGRLAEEREALTIQSLSANGQHAQARAKAASFRKQALDSILLPSIEQVLKKDVSGDR